MPKPFLTADQTALESAIIETLLAGLKKWRSDLDYPESHSDMQACVRGLLIGFEVKRRPLPSPLKLLCRTCEGLGHLISLPDAHLRRLTDCPDCAGRGHTLGE